MNPYESPKVPSQITVDDLDTMSESEIDEFIQPICRRASRLLMLLSYAPPNTFLRTFGIWLIRRWFPVEYKAIEYSQQNGK